MRRAALALLLAAAVAAPLRAQRIEGRLVSARDSTPVPGALVRLLDEGGACLAQTSSGPDGSFFLVAPAAGRYVVAVLRIGQHPWRSPATELPAGLVQRQTLYVPEDPIQLEAISVQARSSCHASPDDQTLIGNLLGEAQKALLLTQLAMVRSAGFFLQTWRRTLDLNFAVVDSTGEFMADARWPIKSAPAESLAAHGFVREDTATTDHPNGMATWYGPDAATLFSLWFLDSHCFSVSEGGGADRDAVVIDYAPARRRRGTDIEGRLVIERTTLALRRLEWTYVRTPEWVTRAGRAGGSMTFARLANGTLVPTQWTTLVPVAQVNNRKIPVRIAGWVEAGGETLVQR